MNELHLFAGGGGGILGGMLLGHTTVCAVEIEPYCREVLHQRQRDGILPCFPIWDDVRTFDGTPWRGNVDAICGGFPCQDISAQGTGTGLDGERSGLWSEFKRIICEIRPIKVLVENSPMLTSRGMGRVLGDLAEMGYNAEWGVLGAHHASGPHKRDRMWIAADSDGVRLERRNNIDTERHGQATAGPIQRLVQMPVWADVSDPRTFGSGDGVACGVDQHRKERLRCIGNGQVPAVASLAWQTLNKGGNS